MTTKKVDALLGRGSRDRRDHRRCGSGERIGFRLELDGLRLEFYGFQFGLGREPDGCNAGRSAAGDSDAEIAEECVQASPNFPDPASWRPGARIDLDAENGFLMIRNDQYASVCVIKNGKGTGTDPYGISTRHLYGNLTAARPFDYLTSYNFGFPATAAIHFGIATSDVTAVSLVGPCATRPN